VGTHATIDPRVEEHVCKELGLVADPVSTQVVARDRHANFMSALALVGGTLERIATEIRHLQRSEVGEAFEPFGKEQKGSSAMPHKRNPVLTERVCGLARVVRGHLVTALENTALWHERDISHSSAERIIFPDACAAVDYMCVEMAKVLGGLEVRPERMLANLSARAARPGRQRHVARGRVPHRAEGCDAGDGRFGPRFSGAAGAEPRRHETDRCETGRCL
jgi:adenylosuccinate lyase